MDGAGHYRNIRACVSYAMFMFIGHSLDDRDIKQLAVDEGMDKKTIADSLMNISHMMLMNSTQAKEDYARMRRRRKIQHMKSQSVKKEKLNFVEYIDKILPKS
jgi:hypothetical protein